MAINIPLYFVGLEKEPPPSIMKCDTIHGGIMITCLYGGWRKLSKGACDALVDLDCYFALFSLKSARIGG